MKFWNLLIRSCAMINQITSKSNKIVTYIKSLHEKKYRDMYNSFFVEGIRFVEDGLKSGIEFKYLIICDEYLNQFEIIINKYNLQNIEIYSVPQNIFSMLSDTKSPQGILGVALKLDTDIEIVKNNLNFILLLEDIQDPGNLGTMIRTADASGVDAIIVSNSTVDTYNPKVLRSTVGSVFHIPILKLDDIISVIDKLISDGFEVYAAHPYGHKSCYKVDMKKKTAIVIGNEANGVSEGVLAKCTHIKIPMIGKSESLNASVAATILMYERLRQNI